jgi:hypothetical protein
MGKGAALTVFIIVLLFSLTLTTHAGEADVLKVTFDHKGGGKYTFTVTVKHADAGWDHFADQWDVVAPDGTVLGTRVLLHPHDNEQPFTRSLVGVKIPPGANRVTVRARDSVHGYGGVEVTVNLAGN